MSVLKTAGLSALIIITMVCIGIIFRLFYKFVLHTEPAHEEMQSVISEYPVWLKIMLVIRAGIVEETFFRAYAITRIKQLTGSNFLAFIIPLIFFAAGHYAYGTINHIVGALLLGLILTIYFIRTKNLIANIYAHTLYDDLGMISV